MTFYNNECLEIKYMKCLVQINNADTNMKTYCGKNDAKMTVIRLMSMTLEVYIIPLTCAEC